MKVKAVEPSRPPFAIEFTAEEAGILQEDLKELWDRANRVSGGITNMPTVSNLHLALKEGLSL